jgi:spore maturation protein CgeB
VNRWFLRQIEDFSPELLFIWGSNWVLSPKTLTHLKARNVRIAIRESNLALFEPHQREALGFYDFFFTGESYIIPLLQRRLGVQQVHYLHGVANPRVYSPYEFSAGERDEWGADAAFFGSPYPNRVEFFEGLSQGNASFRLWGRAWDVAPRLAQHWTPRCVGNIHKSRVYCASKVNLDLRAGHQQINAISSRAFEVLCCGAFVLVEYRSDIERFFEIGRDLDIFHSVEEAAEKIEHYLEHEDERLEMARRGRERALREWTIDDMAARMMTVIQRNW